MLELTVATAHALQLPSVCFEDGITSETFLGTASSTDRATAA
jgi:hypothetical protein